MWNINIKASSPNLTFHQIAFLLNSISIKNTKK
jgi:hypothetical protein